MQKLMPSPMWANTYKRTLVERGLWAENRRHAANLMYSLTIRVYSWQKWLSSKCVRGAACLVVALAVWFVRPIDRPSSTASLPNQQP